MVTGHALHNHHKFYILTATIVVGAILILLLVNDKGEFNFLTGGVVGVNDGGGVVSEGSDEEELIDVGREEEEFVGGLTGIKLDFNLVPRVKEETEINSIKLVSEDLDTKIKINEDELQFKGLEKVELGISNFKGELEFNEISVSLDGEGDKIVVNGMELSNRGKIEISFGDLAYETLDLTEVMLKEIELEKGDGELVIEDKMNYLLDKEGVKIEDFKGDLGVGLDEENLLLIDGTIGGITVKGKYEMVLN